MKNSMTDQELDTISALILFHAQKVSDYSTAVPNRGMVKRHTLFAETLRKAQTLLRGETVTCSGCVRERTEKPDMVCDCCERNPVLADNFLRRVNG